MYSKLKLGTRSLKNKISIPLYNYFLKKTALF